jgi:hypothetical protein
MSGVQPGLYEWSRSAALALVALFAGLAGPLPALAAGAQQSLFASPEAAASALVAAARTNRTGELARILGPGGEKLVSSGDPVADKDGRAKFVAAYSKAHELDKSAAERVTLVVGDDHWPLPIPIVRQGKLWRFDAKAAEQEILARRIGRNELNVIEVCHAYVDAQREYASVDRNGDGILEYAQKFSSAKGKHDGLYWVAKPSEAQSPMGPLVASAHAEGYKRLPYHGYYYKILAAQGKHASGGAYSYKARNRMIGGFALVAYPAEWGNSGIMTFLVNQDGTVYEKNLGPKTESIARAMTVFDPDDSWKTP